MTQTSFELSEHLRPPRRAKRKYRAMPLLVFLAIIGYLTWRLIATGGSIAIGMGEVVLIVLALFALYLGPAFVVSRRRSGHDGLYWRGFVAFHNDDINNKTHFPDLFVANRERPTRSQLSGGVLEVRSDGLHWKSGTYLTRHPRFGGTFFVPWSEVRAIDISLIPMKSKSLGGEITFQIGADDLWFGAEFLARKHNLIRGLERVQSHLREEGATDPATTDDRP